MKSATQQNKKRKGARLVASTCILLLGLGLIALNRPPPPPMTNKSLMSKPTATKSRFFPNYGTPDFLRLCPWTSQQHELAVAPKNCTFRVLPSSTEEGMTDWISGLARAYMMSRETDCGLVFQYADGVDLSQVLIPCGPNWTIPSDFVCERSTCFRHETDLTMLASRLGMDAIVTPPPYRLAYAKSVQQSGPEQYDLKALQRLLPGFQLDRGMACALGSLCCLSPNVASFQPDIFSSILPTLRNENALSFTLYFRTGRTDVVAKEEMEGGAADAYGEPIHEYKALVQSSLDCAVQLEQQYLSRNLQLESRSQDAPLERVVWMLVSDSPSIKEWVKETYSVQDVTNSSSTTSSISQPAISRQVITTGSTGRHTRPKGNPSTAEFAEAFIDWYLIGESDLVVLSSEYSFGATGGLRTSRPLYSGKTCSRQTLFTPQT